MTITYIHWRDACSEEAAEVGTPVPAQPLVDLHEIGFLIGESDESVSIAMELEPDHQPSRWRLHIPKCNIILRRDFDIEAMVKATRGKRRK